MPRCCNALKPGTRVLLLGATARMAGPAKPPRLSGLAKPVVGLASGTTADASCPAFVPGHPRLSLPGSRQPQDVDDRAKPGHRRFFGRRLSANFAVNGMVKLDQPWAKPGHGRSLMTGKLRNRFDRFLVT